MKIVKTFTDLDKALAYITEINEAYEKEVAEKADSIKKAKEVQLALDKEAKAHLATQGSLNESLAEIGTLGEKLALTEAHGSEGLIVSVGKKSFTLVGDTFLYGGSVKTAKELSQDQTQLELMVKKGSASLVQIK